MAFKRSNTRTEESVPSTIPTFSPIPSKSIKQTNFNNYMPLGDNKLVVEKDDSDSFRSDEVSKL
jgi:hypothetical protein